MAEEALKSKPLKWELASRFETSSSSGVGNKLTADDIKRAKGVIIAADKGS